MSRELRGSLLRLLCGVIVIATLITGCNGTRKLAGTDLGATPAPDFTLRDAAGNSFSLRDFRGRAVLLTFLYTHCPDVCPAIAGKLAAADKQLGAAAGRVAFVAVSVDPEGDTPASVKQFSAEHGLDALGDRWRYGLGDRVQLAALWHAYGVGAEPEPAALAAMHPGAADAAVIDHEAVLYLIDPSGRERVLIRPDISTYELVRDLKAIARG